MAAVQGRLQAIDIDTSDCRLWEHGAFRLSVENEAEKAAGNDSEAPIAEADDYQIYVSPSWYYNIFNMFYFIRIVYLCGLICT